MTQLVALSLHDVLFIQYEYLDSNDLSYSSAASLPLLDLVRMMFIEDQDMYTPGFISSHYESIYLNYFGTDNDLDPDKVYEYFTDLFECVCNLMFNSLGDQVNKYRVIGIHMNRALLLEKYHKEQDP